MNASLLPPNRTPLERRVAEANGTLGDIPTPLRPLWHPATIPAALLPYLAWTLSIGVEWEFARTDAERRDLVAAAVELHRYKGTPYAVRRGLQLLGFRDAEIIEGLAAIRHDGEIVRDGSQTFAGSARWALFRIVADLGNQEGLDGAAVARVRRIVEYYKNARSHLHALAFRVTLTSAADRSSRIALPLHVGLQPRRRKGVRDGRYRRGSTRRHWHNGEIHFDASAQRDTPVLDETIRYREGEIYLRHALRVSLGLRASPASLLPRDGRLRYDAWPRRGAPDATSHVPLLRVTRAIPRNGRCRRQGYGLRRDGHHRYADGRPRGARHQHTTTTREVA